MTKIERDAVEAHFGDRVVCDLCGATLATYADQCSVLLDVQCPGFVAIETVATAARTPILNRTGEAK